MTDEMLGRIIEDQVNDTMANNKDWILKVLSIGITNESAPTPNVMAQLAVNAARLASEMSLHMTLRYLESAGVIKFREDSDLQEPS